MEAVIEFELPIPPSVNHYYKRGYRGRVIIGERGKQYRGAAVAALRSTRVKRQKLSGKVWIEIVFIPPDKRRRDVDNILKCLLDSIAHAGLIEDDSQIYSLQIVKIEPEKIGKVTVRMGELR